MTLFELTRDKVAQAYIDMIDQGMSITEEHADEIQADFNNCTNLEELFATLDEYGFGEHHAVMFVSEIMEVSELEN